MSFLQLNKYINIKGGSEIVMKSISDILISNGHSVTNLGFELELGERIVPSRSLGREKKQLKSFFWNTQLVDNIVDIVQEEDVKYIICHNVYHHFPIYQLFKAIKERTEASLILYLHDYKVVCPIHTLYVKNKICEKCGDKKFYNSFFNSCKDQNLLKSLVLCGESYFNNKIFDAYKFCDKIIAPSSFIKEKVHNMGFNKAVTMLYNPVDLNNKKIKAKLESKAVLFLGRISEEKGIRYLLDLAPLLPDIIFYFAGKGPLESAVLEREKKYLNIRFLGYTPREKLSLIFAKVSYLIMPVQWHEIFGLTLTEAMSMGVPVITTGLGGTKELIDNGGGVVISPDDLDMASGQIKAAFEMSNETYEEMIEKGLGFSSSLRLESYYDRLIDIL